MARFVVRSVSTGAGGRPIVRERTHDAAKLMIGRHPSSEVHLPDLGVALYHATLTLGADGRLTLDSPVMTIDPAAGGEVRLGDHRLRFSTGATGEIVVDVASTAPPPPPPRDERRLFTLAGVAPGKRKLSWALALVVLGLFVVWPVWSFLSPARAGPVAGVHPDAAWSPGPLSTPHAALQTNCRACHAKPFQAVQDTSCRSCHRSTHDHADPRRLLAARPDLPLAARLRQTVSAGFGRTPGRCVDCHEEHRGATELSAATPQHFCADCHGALRTKLPDTRLADAADFGTAHPQFRPAVLEAPGPPPRFARRSLDDRPREQSGLVFPHDLHLSRGNAVAQMARRQGQAAAGLGCADCHRADAEGSFRPVSMEANCQSCHSLAFARGDGAVRTLRHGDPAAVVAELRDFYATHAPAPPPGLGGGRRRPGDFAAQELRAGYLGAVAGRGGAATAAIRAVFRPGGACRDCHQVIAPADNSLRYRIVPVVLPRRYLLKGWFDHRAHRTQDCASCHAAGASASATDLLLPTIAQCRTCHAGEQARGDRVRSTCAMCHGYHQDPAGTGPPDPRRRGIVAATGMPQVVRRGAE